jgi:subtilisin family serine protease
MAAWLVLLALGGGWIPVVAGQNVSALEGRHPSAVSHGQAEVADKFSQLSKQRDQLSEEAAAVIDPKVRQRIQAGDAFIPVFIVLKNQPHREVLDRYQKPAELRLEMLETRYKRAAERLAPLSEEVVLARQVWQRELLEVRQAAFREIRQLIQSEQEALERRILQFGGSKVRRYAALNMLAAEVPAVAIETLAADPVVAEVSLIEQVPAQLDVSVPTLGVPTLWSLGYTGAGESVAVLDTGIASNHPAFSGLNLVPMVFLNNGRNDLCFADEATSAQDRQGHGTHVAGIVASRGESGVWSNFLGVAKGLGTLYSLKVAHKGSWDSVSWQCNLDGGVANDADVAEAMDWMIQFAPWVKVFNYSFGKIALTDDDSTARRFDFLADVYGLTITVAAGNYGPSTQTISSPGIGYNIISVANMDGKGTVSRLDDIINLSSSRGPTANFRKKPDIAAPGTNISSTAYDWDGGPFGSNPNFVKKTGTSMAAPHIAGAAALLRQAGVRDPLAIKALLLNTTDTLSWNADVGWGYANLARAWEQRGNTVSSTLSPGSYRLFRASNSSLFYATLVWNRWVYSPAGPGSCLSDLDLFAL